MNATQCMVHACAHPEPMPMVEVIVRFCAVPRHAAPCSRFPSHWLPLQSAPPRSQDEHLMKQDSLCMHQGWNR